MTQPIDWSRAATVPRPHQIDGVDALLRHEYFLLADEVGAGKSKQVIDASQILFERGAIDTVLVVCPAFARGVWANPDPAIGEVAKHSWPSVDNYIFEYSTAHPKVPHVTGTSELTWVISNYEFLRKPDRLLPLLRWLKKRKFWQVVDESWCLNDAQTAQWRAMSKTRSLAARITELNGTPVSETPLNLYGQMRLLHKGILSKTYLDVRGRERWTAFADFRSEYAILNPSVTFPQVVGFKNLEHLREKVSPYILRRRTRDCFDLPPILEPVLIEARLTEKVWKIYKQMREEMVAWLSVDPETGQARAVTAKQALVKSLRLRQITSGFVGGVQTIDLSDEILTAGDAAPVEPDTSTVEEIGREKLDTLLQWLQDSGETHQRLLIWCSFRREVERTAAAFSELRKTFMLYGQQSDEDRQAAIRALSPAVPATEDVAVVGNPNAGGAGLNLSGADMAINLSHDPKLRVYLQSRGRIDRPGQTQPIRYVDVVATGPQGQRTIDHHVLAALRSKQDIAEWTAATWRTKLLEE